MRLLSPAHECQETKTSNPEPTVNETDSSGHGRGEVRDRADVPRCRRVLALPGPVHSRDERCGGAAAGPVAGGAAGDVCRAARAGERVRAAFAAPRVAAWGGGGGGAGGAAGVAAAGERERPPGVSGASNRGGCCSARRFFTAVTYCSALSRRFLSRRPCLMCTYSHLYAFTTQCAGAGAEGGFGGDRVRDDWADDHSWRRRACGRRSIGSGRGRVRRAGAGQARHEEGCADRGGGAAARVHAVYTHRAVRAVCRGARGVHFCPTILSLPLPISVTAAVISNAPRGLLRVLSLSSSPSASRHTAQKLTALPVPLSLRTRTLRCSARGSTTTASAARCSRRWARGTFGSRSRCSF